ncbi:MAG: phage portal protein [Pseudoruegeria sp.]
MNILDRVITSFSPARGLARVRARQEIKVRMNYDAASRGRRTHGWKSPSTNADAAAFGGRQQLRNLSRDMIRNRPYATRAQSVITNNVVGSGVVPSVVCKDQALKDEVTNAIHDHLYSPSLDAAGELGLLEMGRIVMNTVVSDGEILARFRPRSGTYAVGLSMPFQIELIEVDYLDMTITGFGKNEVIEGIEYGPTGAKVAYHILRHHPGTVSRQQNRSSDRVLADNILHIYRADRPGQMRGVPWMAPVMMTMGELSDYQEAQILKQRMAALMAAFITGGDDGPQGGDDSDAPAIDDLAPGAVIQLGSGQGVTFTDPPKVDGYDQFMRQGLSAVAIGMGVTYEALAGDLSGVNFSSARMGRMEMDKNIEVWQRHIVINQFCNGVAKWFKSVWRLSAGANARRVDEFKLEWVAPRRALVDPAREVPALVTEIEAGLDSRQNKQRALGLDPDRVHRERQEDTAREVISTATPVAIDVSDGDDDQTGEDDPEDTEPA